MRRKKNKLSAKTKELFNILYSDDTDISQLNDTKHSVQKCLNEKVEQNRVFDNINTSKGRTMKLKSRLQVKLAQREINKEFKPIKRKW